MSESKWYQITKDQADFIREALSACDGEKVGVHGRQNLELSEPLGRAQKLYDIGFHDELLEDLVAYGQLVGLLTEFPEKQKEVVAHVIKRRPDMVDVLPLVGEPDDEKLKRIPVEVWKDAIQRVAPQSYAEILRLLREHSF